MKFDVEITSVSALLTALEDNCTSEVLVWYRGHADVSWELLPALLRKPEYIAKESPLSKRFKQLAIMHLTDVRPSDDWEWMSLMQHYRVPTRLLDWSESPLAALWFCVNDGNHESDKSDGVIWCLFPYKLNELVKLSGRLSNELPAFGVDEVLSAYELDKLENVGNLRPIAVIANQTSRRMSAQQGNFTLFPNQQVSLVVDSGNSHLGRLTIPSSSKKILAQELRSLGFTELSLFPDMERVAKETIRILENV